MAFARNNGFLMLTHDLDFGAILAATEEDRPSVMQVRTTDIRPETVGGPVITALRQLSEDLEKGALVTIDPRRTRVRLLPLRLRP